VTVLARRAGDHAGVPGARFGSEESKYRLVTMLSRSGGGIRKPPASVISPGRQLADTVGPIWVSPVVGTVTDRVLALGR
jgi:hypothetical protein